MLISRRMLVAFGASAFAGVGVARYPAEAAEFSYRFATENPADHHMTLSWIDAAAKIKDESNGRVEIRVFSNGALGGQVDMLAQVRLGSVELISAGDNILANVVPVAGITATPFVFASGKDALSAMNSPLGRYRRAAIEKAGIYPFPTSWDEGFRQMVNGVRPIHAPADLKGLRMRTPEAPVVIAMFRELGASPTPVTANQMYLALQTHLVDGLDTSLPAVESNKLYEVQKYVSYTYHIWSSYTMLANAGAWQRLPKNLRDIVERNVELAASADNAEIGKIEHEAETKLTGQGMIFNRADVESFRTAIQRSGLYAQWRGTYGQEAWSLLEQAIGHAA